MNPDEILAHAAVSAVNYAEAVAVLRQKSVPDDVIRATLNDFNLTVLPFEAAAADIAGALIPQARLLGIGLGACACACIAAGISRKAKIYAAGPA